jgi:hypothetical protein
MAITAFQTNAETKLAGIAADLLAKTATYDDSAADNENAQLLVWAYQLIKVLRVRQMHAPTSGTATAADRAFKLIGPHTERAFLVLASMIKPIYSEFVTAFNGVDDPTDSPFGANLGDQGTGPVDGPVHGTVVLP